ncbi:putative sterigmatocystin biosynthesis monooxygenase stcW [Neonectria ditissima]|uniref:Putative sterigmatocystin biosynthesis monooxygenase stcW n=1 Tax=Neonectria ditissima TaxID=78410 RepID=A0A0P7BHS7_9HYPO|nr:putative sterigmatocystin biosynthesis monooxygenase stcW [Neonectria ditissima]
MPPSSPNQLSNGLAALAVDEAPIASQAPISTDASSRYQVLEEPLGSTRHIRIVGIGAGMSGINMIRTLKLHLTNYEHVVYEKNPVVGGTWHENRYPGCKCDVPSHNYQFSWRPNPEWTSFFSPAPEIQAYLCRVCEEEDLSSVIRTEHQVERAEWYEERGAWLLKVRNLHNGKVFDDHCDFLLDSCGILNHWKWPTIPGLSDFKGDLVHSADWPESFSSTDKTVALLGNGSSGVQILPELQRTAKRLVHFVRHPTWIVPSRLQLLAQGPGGSILQEIEMNDDETFSTAQIDRFKSDPAFYRKFVKAIEEVVNGNFPLTLKDSEFAKVMQQRAKGYMTQALGGNKRLCSALIPEFPLGCRRLTPGVGYLEALQSANVSVVTEPIVRVVSEGLETSNGELIKVDAIVCATGFDVSFRPRFPVIARDENLQDRWTSHVPKSYMSCAVPGFPNYFSQSHPSTNHLFLAYAFLAFLGPNAPIGHGSVFTITEHIAKYITRIIRKCQMEGIKSITPSQAAVDQLFEHTQSFMPRTAWSGNCTSWFKNGAMDGPVTGLHPGSRIHFFHMLEGFRGEDWEYTYLKANNRFSYLGNGFSTKELDEGNRTWYLDEPDKFSGMGIVKIWAFTILA